MGSEKGGIMKFSNVLWISLVALSFNAGIAVSSQRTVLLEGFTDVA